MAENENLQFNVVCHCKFYIKISVSHLKHVMTINDMILNLIDFISYFSREREKLLVFFCVWHTVINIEYLSCHFILLGGY